MVTKGEREGEELHYKINRYKMLYTKEISNKDLLYSSGHDIQ